MYLPLSLEKESPQVPHFSFSPEVSSIGDNLIRDTYGQTVRGHLSLRGLYRGLPHCERVIHSARTNPH